MLFPGAFPHSSASLRMLPTTVITIIHEAVEVPPFFCLIHVPPLLIISISPLIALWSFCYYCCCSAPPSVLNLSNQRLTWQALANGGERGACSLRAYARGKASRSRTRCSCFQGCSFRLLLIGAGFMRSCTKSSDLTADSRSSVRPASTQERK